VASVFSLYEIGPSPNSCFSLRAEDFYHHPLSKHIRALSKIEIAHRPVASDCDALVIKVGNPTIREKELVAGKAFCTDPGTKRAVEPRDPDCLRPFFTVSFCWELV
jgi:hypothetical protein